MFSRLLEGHVGASTRSQLTNPHPPPRGSHPSRMSREPQNEEGNVKKGSQVPEVFKTTSHVWLLDRLSLFAELSAGLHSSHAPLGTGYHRVFPGTTSYYSMNPGTYY